MTDLKDKAINIKGKQYVLVSDRILAFNADYPQGSIRTELVSTPEAEVVIIKATVLPDFQNPERYYTGYSQARWGDGYINKTSALENAETSAVGRALAMMGIGVIDSVASVDEINKAESSKGGVAVTNTTHPELDEEIPTPSDDSGQYCSTHMVTMQQGFSKTKRDSNNNPKAYWFHKENGQMCFGN